MFGCFPTRLLIGAAFPSSKGLQGFVLCVSISSASRKNELMINICSFCHSFVLLKALGC